MRSFVSRVPGPQELAKFAPFDRRGRGQFKQSKGPGLAGRQFDWVALSLVVICVLSIWELRLSLIYDAELGQVSGQSAQPYFGNLTIGDFAIVAVYVWLWTLSEFRGFLVKLLRTWMGFAGGGLTISVLLLSPLSVEQDAVYNIKQAVQLAANVAIVVPVFAFLFATVANVPRLFLRISLFYMTVVFGGALLYFLAGRQDVFRSSGDLRLYPNVAHDALQYCVLGYAGIQFLTSSSLGQKLVALLSMATFVLAAVLGASRTMFVAMVAVAVALVVFGAHLRVRSVVLYCVVSAIAIFGIYQYMFVGITDLSVVMVRTDGFSDLERTLLISDGWARVSQTASALFFGLGWDRSGIHNLAIQTFVDAGALVASFMLLLVLAPLLEFRRFRRIAPGACQLGAGVLVGFIFFYSLNALPTLRVYWIPLGIVVGLAMRARMAASGPTRP